MLTKNRFDEISYLKKWVGVPAKKSWKVRESNLILLTTILGKNSIKSWLFGRTLLYLYKAKFYPEDPFDEVGVWDYDFNTIKFKNELIKSKFEIVKSNKYQIWIIKNERIIKINSFKKNNDHVEMNYLKFNSRHFNNLSFCNYNEVTLPVPSVTNNLLEDIYAANGIQKLRRNFRKILHNSVNIKDKIKTILEVFNIKLPNFIMNIWHNYRTGDSKNKYLTVELKEQDFLKLILDKDQFNWHFRSQHLGIISNNGKCQTVEEIINYNKKNDLEKNIIVTDTNRKFQKPLYWNYEFWNSGNNYFIFPIIYGFRKNVLGYEFSNEYISKNLKPMLYSKEYYLSLEKMTYKEIKIFNKKNPIEITNRAISSGRHRACAMIGRLVRGEKYIPFYARVLPTISEK